jgi:hypothetical protein
LVGIEETIDDGLFFNVYPNPASEYLIIQFNESIAVDFKISMYDITGRQILLPVKEKITAGNYAIYVPVDFLPPGMYFITIQDNETRQVYSKKIVIQ